MNKPYKKIHFLGFDNILMGIVCGLMASLLYYGLTRAVIRYHTLARFDILFMLLFFIVLLLFVIFFLSKQCRLTDDRFYFETVFFTKSIAWNKINSIILGRNYYSYNGSSLVMIFRSKTEESCKIFFFWGEAWKLMLKEMCGYLDHSVKIYCDVEAKKRFSGKDNILTSFSIRVNDGWYVATPQMLLKNEFLQSDENIDLRTVC